MPFTVNMPKLSPTMEEGTIAKWHKQEGDKVEAGDLLMEVATDKATLEYHALDEGFLRKILITENGSARVGDPLAVFSEDANEDISQFTPQAPQKEEAPQEEASAPSEKQEKKQATPPPQGGGLQQPAFVPAGPTEKKADPYLDISISEPTLASPLAKKIAKEKGIDLSQVQGSGPHGRVKAEDLENQPVGNLTQFHQRVTPTHAPGTYTEVPLSPMRKVIGERLQASKTFIPHFYVSMKVNVTKMIDLRAQLKSQGLRLTVNDFITRACAIALKKHPVINQGYNSQNNTIIKFETIDISIAVQIPDGLITPIVTHADYKRIDAISKEVKSLATKAKEGKLSPEEYQGGSFTISNLGMYNVSEFLAVINPPQAAILAVAGVEDKLAYEGELVVTHKIMTLTLAADHRVVDGKDSAEFLQTVKTLLENPANLII